MDIEPLWALGGWLILLLDLDCMATHRSPSSQPSILDHHHQSHPLLLFLSILFLLLLLIRPSDQVRLLLSDPTVPPSASASSTVDLHPREQNPGASARPSCSERTRCGGFGAEAHEVPSGPNPISNKVPQRAPTEKWRLPEGSGLKLNVDGAVSQDSEVFGVGTVLRNNRGVVIVAKSYSETCSTDTALARLENPGTKNPPESVKATSHAENIPAQIFTFRELAKATRNFRKDCMIGEGGFGRVYKAKLQKTGQEVAVKQLDKNGLQGQKEFLVEVHMLSLLHDQHLVNLIGYCADGEQRLLVYEYMPMGSLEDHLLDCKRGQEPLDWHVRMKIALGAAKGLQYLHDMANPPVIYRDLKSSNILLDRDFNAKLSDFGLAKHGPMGDKTHVSTRIMGTYGYCAPEYQRTGQLTVMSDVYSFGVVLLEMITGRRAIDTTKRAKNQTLVAWAQPIFKEPSRYPELADPLLKGNFPSKALGRVVSVAYACLNEVASSRPTMSKVVNALSRLDGPGDDHLST